MTDHPAQHWLKTKLLESPGTVMVARTISKDFRRHTGGRTLFAAVTLTLAPASAFSLTFAAEPSETDYRRAIEDAIFCELLTSHTQPILGVSVLVDAVEEDPVGSCYAAFKVATRDAMTEALRLSDGATNTIWPKRAL
jgi:hypothetical protein